MADNQTDEKILAQARERFKRCMEAEGKLRQRQIEDKRFAAGDHWPAWAKSQREAEGRPMLTIDRLTPQIKQVTNQQRAMRPAIQINPVDNGADPDTAEVLQGICRHIETRSNADDAYDQAGRDQTEIGRGYFRILTDYVNDDEASLDQEIQIKRIRNPFTVYFDPARQERDYSDAMFAFVFEDVPLDEFKAQYPNATFQTTEAFETLGDEQPQWIIGGSVRKAEYWYVELSDVAVKAGKGARKKRKRKVCCVKMTGLEVLERYDWLGKWIPIVPVLGEEIDLDGEVDYRGMVRRAKDPQRMFNFWKTATTEAVALAPLAPFVAAEGQLEGYEKMWRQANRKPLPYLVYKPVAVAGTLAPPPSRNVAEAPVQAMMALTQGSENDLRAAVGFYDVDTKERQEQSGRAILARKRMGEEGNSDYLDGLGRAIRHAGRILIDLIPKIYDTPRVLRILGRDNQQRAVLVHGGQAPTALPAGIDKAFDLSVGIYDVTVSVGPSVQTARQEFIEQIAPMFQGNPQLFQLIGDLFFENLDFPNARQIAERLKKLLPPALQDDQQQDPAVLQQQLMAAGQQIEQMGMALQEAQRAIEAKQIEAQSRERIAAAEIASKENIAALQAELEKAKLQIEAQLTQAKIQHEEQKMAFQADQERRNQEREQFHSAAMADREGDRQMAREADAGMRAEHMQNLKQAGAERMAAAKQSKDTE